MGEDLLQGLGRGAGCDGLGPDDAVRIAVADDLEVEVVGGLSRVSMVYSCWRDSARLPGRAWCRR